ncbi:MAG: hypothetical protein ACREEL_05555 [Stellaceae bacterium]
MSQLKFAHFKAELAAVRRVGARRARERQEADAAAWRALAGVTDGEPAERRSGRTAILARCREWLLLDAHAAHRAHKRH